jgi:hypothetical protein
LELLVVSSGCFASRTVHFRVELPAPPYIVHQVHQIRGSFEVG